MSRQFSVVRACFSSVERVLAELAPNSSEAARLKLLLQTDELWLQPPATPLPPSSSGEHAISIRYRPSKLSALNSPTGRATLVSLAIALLQVLANHWPVGGAVAPADVLSDPATAEVSE